mmetsp:Transcript_61966/g.146754  ORF Transcript_61966/g.146754 Transcript_61966/m.146754 type:complete len:96 (+) Transcript_61966:815-1102(+)
MEQLILKFGAHEHCTNIKEAPVPFQGYGIFLLKFCDCLSGVLHALSSPQVPIRKKGESEQLLSKDTHSGTANTRVSMSASRSPRRAPVWSSRFST